MFHPAHYRISSKIYESKNSIVFRGERIGNNQPVILKVLKEEYPTPTQIGRYQQEFSILKRLNSTHIIKSYDVEKHQNILFLVLEDFGGYSLKEYLKDKKLGIEDFLTLAIKIVSSLIDIHTAQVIHKDINPSNIVLNAQTGQLKIIDFGIATLLSRETLTLKNPDCLEGTLTYLSPEQTGRINRVVDYRTDLYSLGVTLYEMLTGELPFNSIDSMELVHCHLAKIPLAVCALNPTVPLVLSDIIMKLLAKNAEDRYQSAFGLKQDLENCLHQLHIQGEISYFPLAQQDFSGKCQIPQKLYGRETEVKQLLKAFDAITDPTNGCNSEMVLIAGYSGVGKSALVNEVHKPMTEKRGYFISGKFEQYQRNIPYFAITQAFNTFCHYLLTESNERLRQWQEDILKAVGSNGQVLIDIIPALELIINQQPSIAALPPQETQNRFNLVFQNFFKVIAQREHPLVLFIDDLQWADLASLTLLKMLMLGTQSGYFLIIGAYRDNEVNATHPLLFILDELQKASVKISTIFLKNLSKPDVNRLISDTLHCELADTQELTQLIYSKTQGNAFFTHEFIKSLYNKNLLTFDFHKRCWQWKINEISAQHMADNVVELMANKIRDFTAATQEILKLAACIGNQFNLRLLSLVAQQTPTETLRNLWLAIEEGLLLPIGDFYRQINWLGKDNSYLMQPSDSLLELEVDGDFKFQHDRVQQSAYSLISEENRHSIHLTIGRLLLKHHPGNLEDYLFDIANQFNQGIYLIHEKTEKRQLAELNFSAAKKAKSSNAHRTAINYFTLCIELLSHTEASEVWHSQYSLIFSAHVECAECAYLTGQFTQAETLLELALAHANSDMDKATVYRFKLNLYATVGEMDKAIEIGRHCLTLFDIHLPLEPSLEEVERAHSAIWQTLGNRQIADLIDLPPMMNVQMLTVMQLLVALWTPTHFRGENLHNLVVIHLVNLSLLYGTADESVYGYVFLAMYLCDRKVGRYHEAYQFGKLSYDLVEKRNLLGFKSKVNLLFGDIVNFYKRHFRTDRPYLHEVFRIGLESGDLIFACYSRNHIVTNMLVTGEPLEAVWKESVRCLEFVRKAKDPNIEAILISQQRFILNMLGRTQHFSTFDAADFNQNQFEAQINTSEMKLMVFWYYIHKITARFISGDYEESAKTVTIAKELERFDRWDTESTNYFFFAALALAAHYPSVTKEKQSEYLETLRIHQKQLQTWAENCPENFFNRYALVSAEIARIQNNDFEAQQFYHQAIYSAHENEFIHNEAIAHELAAKFYLAHGFEEYVTLHLTKAHHAYQLWGAVAKVQDLEKHYSQFLFLSEAKKNRGSFKITTNTMTSSTYHLTSTPNMILDLNSVVKASQALLGEIVLNKLLEKMMHTVIENAGAQRGLLILEREGHWFIEAEGVFGREEVVVLQSLPLPDHVPLNIVNYVTRTYKPVVLASAMNEGLYTEDNYVRQHRLRSVLCIPLLRKHRLTGLIYLENNITDSVFTPARIEVLQLLSSQIAISLENAQFVAEVEKARHAAEIANHAKTAFLANVSHELRTPLNQILGYGQLLERDSLIKAKFHEEIRGIRRSSQYLLNLVNDILDIAHMETGQLTLSSSEFHLGKLLYEIIDIFRDVSKQKHLAFNCGIDPDLPDGVCGDAKRLRQILVNLLSNAVKFTHRGGITLTVNLRNEAIHFAVTDTGIGIAPESLNKIFLPFEQLSDWKCKSEGIGLGLSITKKLIELMGGHLQVTSELNKGSTFEFEIMLPIHLEWVDSTARTMSTVIGYEGVHRTILIVDDFSENRALLADMLTPLGFSIVQAGNGLEGLERLQRTVPDLIFVDLVMPRMDGFEFIRQVRQIPLYQSVPIVATSISSFETQFLQEDIPGCNAYLTKPWYKEDLLEILAEQLSLVYIHKQKQSINLQSSEEIEALPERVDVFPMIGLSAEEAACFLDLALKGDYRGITQFSRKLEETNPCLKPFLDTINYYAKQFDDESICELVKPYLLTN